MKKYINPELEIVVLENCDVMTTSSMQVADNPAEVTPGYGKVSGGNAGLPFIPGLPGLLQ